MEMNSNSIDRKEAELQSRMSNLGFAVGYTRLPERLARMYPSIAAGQKDDVHGVAGRLRAIETLFADENLGAITDLGGNSGYFCLSLLDAGLATSARVYDVQDKALAAGRLMAELLDHPEIEYIQRNLELAFVETRPPCDTFICLSLLHHAGILFDVDNVRTQGWERYMGRWLAAMKQKSRRVIVGLAFDDASPVNWSPPAADRPAAFRRICEEAGWSVRYYANVRELERLGTAQAAGRVVSMDGTLAERTVRYFAKVTRHPVLRRLREVVRSVLRRTKTLGRVRLMTGSTHLYHFYVLELK